MLLRTFTQRVKWEGRTQQARTLPPNNLRCNLIIDKTMKSVKNVSVYKLHRSGINVISYEDDATLTAENEDNLQRLVSEFNNRAQSFNMKISTTKTKLFTTEAETIRCKIVV